MTNETTTTSGSFVTTVNDIDLNISMPVNSTYSVTFTITDNDTSRFMETSSKTTSYSNCTIESDYTRTIRVDPGPLL